MNLFEQHAIKQRPILAIGQFTLQSFEYGGAMRPVTGSIRIVPLTQYGCRQVDGTGVRSRLNESR